MKHIRHRVAAGFAVALLLATPLAIAHADVLIPTEDESPLLFCTENGDVFVVVTYEDGTTESACVNVTSSGTAVLEAAGISITRDASNMICSLNNKPDPCPATFDGKYWQYYQASGPDADMGNWDYATTGSDDSKPQPGWVEGWCYGEECLPQYPGVGAAIDINNTGGNMVAWIIGGSVAVVVIILAVVLLVRRRQPAEAEA